MAATFQVGCYEYTVSGTIGELPPTYSALIQHATLHDDFAVSDSDGTALVVTVQRVPEMWPRLVVSKV